MRLSVIIPTLNESASLAETIAVLRARTSGSPVEIVVADCRSADDTPAIAARSGVRVETGPSLSSRAAACNAGATAATGDTLLFVHADSRVPERYDELIEEALASPNVVGGAFELRFDGPEWRLRVVELINRLRYRTGGRFFGDQGIFVRRRVFNAIGGFPRVGILEDAYFCAKARRAGVMTLISEAMMTSPRRFYNGGILRTLIFDMVIVLADLLGLDPERFARTYGRGNLNRGLTKPEPAQTQVNHLPPGTRPILPSISAAP